MVIDYQPIGLLNSPGLWPTGVLGHPNFPSSLLVVSLSTGIVSTCFVARVAAYRTRATDTCTACECSDRSGVLWTTILSGFPDDFYPIGKNIGIAPKRPKEQNKSTLGGPVSETKTKNQLWASLFTSTFQLPHKLPKMSLELTASQLQWFLTIRNLAIQTNKSYEFHILFEPPEKLTLRNQKYCSMRAFFLF